jgi:hypothetical protein
VKKEFKGLVRKEDASGYLSDGGWRVNSCEDCNYGRWVKGPYRLELRSLALVPVRLNNTIPRLTPGLTLVNG